MGWDNLYVSWEFHQSNNMYPISRRKCLQSAMKVLHFPHPNIIQQYQLQVAYFARSPSSGEQARWTNTICNLDKYIHQFEEIHFPNWTKKVFCFLLLADRRHLESRRQISNSQSNCLSQGGQIQFSIWANIL